MYEQLAAITLKDGEQVEAGCVEGPNLEWAERVEALLGHKGSLRLWQNAEVVRRELGIEGRFYLLHRRGEPMANIMTVVHKGVGYLGHVWTRPEDRRKGACDQLMGIQMEHFRQTEGQALFLGTGFATPPYRIYAAHGFASIEAESGSMEYYAGSRRDFIAEYFAAGTAEIEELAWSHWPASAALFLGDFPGVVRSVSLVLLGRASTEGKFLPRIRDELQRRAQGEAAQTLALVQRQTGAVLGLASWSWDPLWPETALVDIYCHPKWWTWGSELLSHLQVPPAERYLAYVDGLNASRDEVLAKGGFAPAEILRKRVAADRARQVLVDVTVWQRSF